MRTKRNQKIPQNLEDFVHSINTVKTKNTKTASKNSGNSKENLSKNNHDKRNNGVCGCDNGRVEDESNKGMRIKVRKEKRNDGFVGDLTGIQFPPINGMVENVNEEIEGQKDCLGNGDNCKNGSAKSDDCVAIVNEGYASCNNEHGVEVNDDVEEVVKKTNEVKNETLQSVDNSLDVFQDEEWIKEVINNGLWMVNNKPLVSVKEISALASSIRKPVIMDEITAMMCVTRVGRIGFARVLVEITAMMCVTRVVGMGRAVWHEPEQFSSELNNISLELYTVQRSVQRQKEKVKCTRIIPRTYNLSHCDFTADLTLTISNVINHDQLKGWHDKDDVVAKWAEVKGHICLDVHCYVSEPNSLLDIAAEFR
ncbi:stay-green like, chloroplastic-like protein [Tanacetum coccineum]